MWMPLLKIHSLSRNTPTLDVAHVCNLPNTIFYLSKIAHILVKSIMYPTEGVLLSFADVIVQIDSSRVPIYNIEQIFTIKADTGFFFQLVGWREKKKKASVL